MVRVLVEVLEPTHGRVYDPCCGSGGMFVQTEKFLEAHRQDPSAISVYGQALDERTWRTAKMNFAIHGLNANLGPIWADTFARDLHPQVDRAERSLPDADISEIANAFHAWRGTASAKQAGLEYADRPGF